jgi:hypothetical protein
MPCCQLLVLVVLVCRRNGWYPAVLGPGNVAAKGRIPYALLAIMDTLRLFPGQVGGCSVS